MHILNFSISIRSVRFECGIHAAHHLVERLSIWRFRIENTDLDSRCPTNMTYVKVRIEDSIRFGDIGMAGDLVWICVRQLRARNKNPRPQMADYHCKIGEIILYGGSDAFTTRNGIKTLKLWRHCELFYEPPSSSALCALSNHDDASPRLDFFSRSLIYLTEGQCYRFFFAILLHTLRLWIISLQNFSTGW